MKNLFETSDGTRIEYEYTGEVNRDTQSEISLVFLNGIFMHYESWKILTKGMNGKAPMLFHNFRCQWGSGCNDTKECSFERHALDLKELLDFLGIKKAKVVGTSYGGEVGMLFGSMFPEYIDSMMIITSTARTDNVMETKALRWKDGAASEDPQIFVRSWLTDVYSEAYISSFENLANIISSRLQGFNYRGAVRLLEAFFELNKYDLLEKVREFQFSVLIVSAEYDGIKPKIFSEEIYQNIKKALHITIPNSGHAVVVEKPREVGYLIRTFANSDFC
ncbi:MAG: alpha/beta fold hydrolase [Fervidobacterium sp.]|uniref:alpha/beta fold hydrolase n=1 Tax=Fervidobacterium sp. TaxID=1871331 RepID=UPI0040493A23